MQATLAGAYELERELGGGGMSRVFLAHETALGRKVVVKVLLPTLAAGVSAERFRREILLVAKLQHPHIVPVHAAGESDGLPWFTMPFVEGESLRTRIAREGELPVPEVVRLLRDIASALSYAHAQGVIHRDIKPDNVLISAGSAVVADFGVAKALSESVTEGDQAHITSLGIALGTPAYMAPEQAAGDQSMDHRVDLYAFGVMAYEMLSGRAPFTGRTPQAMIAAHFTEAPVPLENHRPTVPAALAGLIMRCLEKHAADRPTGADDVLHVLDSMTTPSGGMPPTTGFRRPPRTGTQPSRAAKRVPWPWIGAGAAAAGAIALLLLLPRDDAGQRVETTSSPAAITAPAPVSPTPADSAQAAPSRGAPEAAESPGPEAAEPPSRREAPARPPSRQPAAAAPDTIVTARLRLTAIGTRREAASAGASAAQLARGDSLLARGDALRRDGRPQEAAIAYSSAGSAWAGVSAAIAAARPAGEVSAAEPVQQPEPEEEQPPQPARTDPRPAVESVVAAYAGAIESRSTARIREVYPGLTAQQEQDWRQFFEAVGDVQVTLGVTDLQVSGDVAEATATGEYVFENSTTRRTDRQPATVRMSFRRGPGGEWRLVAIR